MSIQGKINRNYRNLEGFAYSLFQFNEMYPYGVRFYMVLKKENNELRFKRLVTEPFSTMGLANDAIEKYDAKPMKDWLDKKTEGPTKGQRAMPGFKGTGRN